MIFSNSNPSISHMKVCWFSPYIAFHDTKSSLFRSPNRTTSKSTTNVTFSDTPVGRTVYTNFWLVNFWCHQYLYQLVKSIPWCHFWKDVKLFVTTIVGPSSQGKPIILHTCNPHNMADSEWMASFTQVLNNSYNVTAPLSLLVWSQTRVECVCTDMCGHIYMPIYI